MHKITWGISLISLAAVSGVALAQQSLEEYDAQLRTNDGLATYNALLERQIATQQRQITELQASIGEVPDLERQIPALIQQMVDMLDDFVESDIPFHADERRDRVANLRNLVESAAVNDIEKLRRVFEAWEIENDYGREVSAYSGLMPIGGNDVDVSFLQIGRVALLFQTQDLAVTGMWNPETRQFVVLDNEHRNSVQQALRMAQNAVAPDLALLPVAPPQ